MNKLYLYLVTALLFLGGMSFAQEQLSLRQQADKLYNAFQYAKAALVYQKLTVKEKADLHDLERLANCYRKMNDFEAAERLYSRVVKNPLSGEDNLLLYGEMLKANANYTEAKKVFQLYAQKTIDDKRVAINIAGCDSALVWLANPGDFKVVNESSVNTALSEFAAFKLNNKVYYAGEPQSEVTQKTYGWTGHSYLKIYTAGRESNNRLNNPLIATEIFNNGVYHDGPVVSNNNGTVFYLTRTYSGKNRKNELSTNMLELHIYTKSPAGEWSAAPFLYNGNHEYSVGHAALSKDENTLYFVSDMSGGLGGTDIWYSEKQGDGSWGKPQNAGPAINTVENEMFPTIAIDGKLYYSTNGLPGMGAMDIFSSTGGKSVWTAPVNLKFPINSSGDDFSFSISDSTNTSLVGYFSSNRKNGKGGDDIYSFTYEKSKNIPAMDTHRDPSSQFSIADSMRINVENIQKYDTVNMVITLQPVMQIGKTIQLKNVHYDLDKSDLRADTEKSLPELLQILKAQPRLKIELSSHTDSRGNKDYNMQLSQRRAQSVVDYLISKGIDSSRLVAKGYGESRLINRCSDGVICTEEEHQENRRTEFTILAY